MGNNYNKYFNSNKNQNRGLRSNSGTVDESIPSDTKDEIIIDIKQNSNNKKISGTSHELPLENESKVQTKIQTKARIEVETKTQVDMTNGSKAAVVANYKLNVRQEPNKLSEVLCILDPGTNIMVDNIRGDWAHIYTEHGIEGYVIKEYIIISKL